MKDFFKEYFTFAKRDRNGLLALAIILILILLVPYSFAYVIKREQVDYSIFEAEVAEFRKEFILAKENAKQKKTWEDNKFQKKKEVEPISTPISLHNFNPNELTAEKAIELGLTPKVAHTIQNYLTKGGKFYKKEDFKKIYGVTDADYNRLLPYMILPQKNKRVADSPPKDIPKNTFTIELFQFDPNQLNKKDAMRLGLSEKIGNNIEKYLNKGGKFYKKEDFKKIYGITEADFERLEPYIDIKSKDEVKGDDNAFAKANQTNKPNTFFEPEANISVDINTADTIIWKKLKGIGSSYAGRIVKYRQMLGGFLNKEQLREVYGLEEDLFLQISPYLVNDNINKIVQLNINEADIDALKSHPYISYKVASSIVKIREQHGLYKTVEGIKQSFLIDDDLFQKISPYLTL